MLPGGPDHHPGRPGAAWANAAAAALSWDVRAGAAQRVTRPSPRLGRPRGNCGDPVVGKRLARDRQ